MSPLIFVCALLLKGVPAQAAAWDEALNGDLSNDRLLPTTVSVAPGSNTVIGTTGNSGSGVDRDYFRFTVPQGAVLSAINLLGNTSVSGGTSFFAIQAGPQITCTPTGLGVENLLGFTHYGNDQINTDILPGTLIGASSPLPSGTYSIWVQDTGGPATYGFELIITPLAAESGDVPTLPQWGALVLGLSLLTMLWRQSSERKFDKR